MHAQSQAQHFTEMVAAKVEIQHLRITNDASMECSKANLQQVSKCLASIGGLEIDLKSHRATIEQMTEAHDEETQRLKQECHRQQQVIRNLTDSKDDAILRAVKETVADNANEMHELSTDLHDLQVSYDKMQEDIAWYRDWYQ